MDDETPRYENPVYGLMETLPSTEPVPVPEKAPAVSSLAKARAHLVCANKFVGDMLDNAINDITPGGEDAQCAQNEVTALDHKCAKLRAGLDAACIAMRAHINDAVNVYVDTYMLPANLAKSKLWDCLVTYDSVISRLPNGPDRQRHRRLYTDHYNFVLAQNNVISLTRLDSVMNMQ